MKFNLQQIMGRRQQHLTKGASIYDVRTGRGEGGTKKADNRNKIS